MKLDMPAQRLLISALKAQIQAWRVTCENPDLSEDDIADIQNDIGYAFTVLSKLEEQYFQEFGRHAM
jgi:hypothetical protein